MAPEMLRRSGHTRSVDWYLLGVLVYEMLVGIPPYHSVNQTEMFNNIQRGKLRMPKSISKQAKDFMVKLLNRDPNKRLGATSRDSEELKEHPFFERVDWVAFKEKRVPPPSVYKVGRVFRDISSERMFGMLETAAQSQLEGWSFMGAN